ncbi:hypothetical protein PENTCL1PPCAC_24121, partial [Pristionchus entomophagus]
GSASFDSLGFLYDAIGRSEAKMIFECQNLPLLFFARSFAVVMEEAVRQKRRLQQLQADRKQSSSLSLFLSSPPSSDSSRSPAADAAAARAAASSAMPTLNKRTDKGIDLPPEATECSVDILPRSERADEMWALLGPIGRVIIHRIPIAVNFEDVRLFLRQIGRLNLLHYP